jgi:hypothetical protein
MSSNFEKVKKFMTIAGQTETSKNLENKKINRF